MSLAVPEIESCRQRPCDQVLDVRCRDCACRTRDHHLAQARGVNPDKRMIADRIENSIYGYGAGIAEIRRAEDRHVGDDAAIFDQIADAHDVAVNNRFGLEPGLIWGLRDRPTL